MENIIKTPALQYYIVVEGHSWATFVISEKGALFINSDWGYWTYAWRAFGPSTFNQFLIDITADYLLSKLESNARQFYGVKQKLSKRQIEAITALFTRFQQELKSNG